MDEIVPKRKLPGYNAAGLPLTVALPATTEISDPASPYAAIADVLNCSTGGSLLQMGMDEYFPFIDKRPSPAGLVQARQDRIISIELAGPVLAMARVECAILPKRFVDLLTLVCLQDRWQIISKVFHFEID